MLTAIALALVYIPPGAAIAGTKADREARCHCSVVWCGTFRVCILLGCSLTAQMSVHGVFTYSLLIHIWMTDKGHGCADF
jgi:hypothetical protein